MARRIIAEFDILAQPWLQVHVRKIEFGLKERRRQIKQSVCREHLQMRIFALRIGEIARDIGLTQRTLAAAEPAAGRMVIPIPGLNSCGRSDNKARRSNTSIRTRD